MFKLEDKYKLTANFIKKTVDIAKKELDAKSPYSFLYKTNKIGRKTNSVTLYPMCMPKNRDSVLEKKDLAKKIPLGWDLE